MTITERLMDLSLLWKQASVAFPYFDRLELDWDAVYRAYMERELQVETDREHFLLLAEFLNTLGDGHTDVRFPQELLDEVGYLPFQMQYANEKYYVNYEEILAINGEPMQAQLDRVFHYIYHVGNYASQIALHRILPFFLKKTGNVLLTTGGSQSFDLLPEPLPRPAYGNVTLTEYGDILHIRLGDFHSFRVAEQVREALPGKRAVILDIRENVGGYEPLCDRGCGAVYFRGSPWMPEAYAEAPGC